MPLRTYQMMLMLGQKIMKIHLVCHALPLNKRGRHSPHWYQRRNKNKLKEDSSRRKLRKEYSHSNEHALTKSIIYWMWEVKNCVHLRIRVQQWSAAKIRSSSWHQCYLKFYINAYNKVKTSFFRFNRCHLNSFQIPPSRADEVSEQFQATPSLFEQDRNISAPILSDSNLQLPSTNLTSLAL